MNSTATVAQWLNESIFWIGIFIMITGLLFIFIPNYIEKIAVKMNKWICTNTFFHMMDRPRYKERFFYRHHKIVGSTIIICSIYIYYIFLIDIGYATMLQNLQKLAQSAFTEWLYPQLLNILLIATIFSLVIGVLIVVRPSALKKFELFSNHWFDTNSKLKVFDSTHSLPEEKVRKNSRLFGFFIFLAGCYVTANMYFLVF